MSDFLFDMHAHFFGPVFFRTLAMAAHPQGDPGPGFARLLAAGIEVIREDAPAHARRWVAEMDRHGLARMALFASIPDEAPSVAEAVAVAPGRFVPFCLVDPTAADAVERVRTLVEKHGMQGLLLFPAMHRYLPSDRGLDGFYEVVQHFRLPLVTHMGTLRIRVRDILGLPTDFDISCANPVHLAPAARRFPGIRFIIPHFGGGYFRETLMTASECENVAVDTSSSNGWTRLQPGRPALAEIFTQALDVLGASRIHFGTDSSTFPRGWRDDIHREQAAILDALAIPPTDRAAILGGNSSALFDR